MITNAFPKRTRQWMLIVNSLALIAPAALASYIGGERPAIGPIGGPETFSGGQSGISLTEGNLREVLPITSVESASGPSINLYLTYNSYNADGSHAELDTVVGYGWTHSYNLFLFNQVGSLFLMDGNGRTEKFVGGPGGTLVSDSGYFQTLVKNTDGSYTLTDKHQTSYQFAIPSGTPPFIVGGPVYSLQTITDRNTNVTTLTYSGGLPTRVTDTYGRVVTFSYNSSHQLATVTDPLGHVTSFTYDSTGRQLSKVTDPLGHTTQFGYNSLHQITQYEDRNGRVFTYQYLDNYPIREKDGSSANIIDLSNTENWSTSATELAQDQERYYDPGTTRVTDGRGNVWTYQYDSDGFPTFITNPDGSTSRYTYDPGTLEMSSMTDPNGNTTKWAYDSVGNLIQTTDPLGLVTTYTYEPIFNMMTSVTDPNGRSYIYQYDTAGNRIKETDPLGETRSWTYDSHGNVTSSTTRRGFTTQYQYNSSGDLIQTTDPLGNITLNAYDADGNRTSMTDALGRTTRYAYDSDDRQITVTDPLGYVTTTAYDADGDVIRVTDANGHVTSYTYDVRDRLIGTTNALGGVTTTAYDLSGNVIDRTDADNHTTVYAYDVRDRQIRTTDPLGHTRSTAYDGDNNVISTTDPRGFVTQFSYDALNRNTTMEDTLGNTTTYGYVSTPGLACCGATAGSDLDTNVIDADGKYIYYNYDALNRIVQRVAKSGGTTDTITPSDAVTTYTYDADGNQIATTDPNGNTTKFTFDALDREIGSTNAAGDVSITAYDAVGNIVQTVSPRGDMTTTIYDADNRVIEITDSLGVVSSSTYDAVGNQISSTDGDGNTTKTMYDALNRPIKTIDPLGRSSTTAYDAVGNVISRTDRDGYTTLYAYDADNREISTTDPFGNTSTTAYDASGNVISTTDPLSHTTRYMYDGVNRVTGITYADTPTDALTYGYDGTDHRISRMDQNGVTTTYQYDDFYRLTDLKDSTGIDDRYTYDLGNRLTGATEGAWIDTYTYDAADRVITSTQGGESITYSYNIPGGTRTITYPGGTTLTESYDLRDRISMVNDGGLSSVTRYTYDADDDLLTRADRNGASSAYSYNGNNWITAVEHTEGASRFAGFTYAYDHDGNRIYQSNQVAVSESEAYAYDALDRLTKFDVGELVAGVISTPSLAEAWKLDAVDNWVIYTNNTVAQDRTHNAVNEITTIGGSPLTYDADGNLIDDGTYTYTYDGENRLTTVTRDIGATVVGQYAYDAEGRRVMAIVNPSGTPVTTLYFYDGSRVIEEQDASLSTQATYSYGESRENLTMQRGGETYYYYPNAQSSVEALADSTGAVVERYAYDSYGEPTVENDLFVPQPLNSWGTPHSSVGNPWLFVGARFGEESGLYNDRVRDYDPLKGRFTERDPVISAGPNLYAYGTGNPLTDGGAATLDDKRKDPDDIDPGDLELPPLPATPPPRVAADAGKIAQWIKDLDSNKFAERQRAKNELVEEFNNKEAIKQVEKALESKDLSAEQRRLLEIIVETWKERRFQVEDAPNQTDRALDKRREDLDQQFRDVKDKHPPIAPSKERDELLDKLKMLRKEFDDLESDLPPIGAPGLYPQNPADLSRRLHDLKKKLDDLAKALERARPDIPKGLEMPRPPVIAPPPGFGGPGK